MFAGLLRDGKGFIVLSCIPEFGSAALSHKASRV